MRNPAEADKLTPGADPASRSGKEPDASESTTESPTVGRAACADDGPCGYDLFMDKKDGCVRSVFQPSA
jgi:hypothetical protein